MLGYRSCTPFLTLKGGLDSISFSAARCVPPPELHYTLAEITLLLPLLAVSFSLDDDCAALFYNAFAVLPLMFPHFSLSETFLIRAHKLKNWRSDVCELTRTIILASQKLGICTCTLLKSIEIIFLIQFCAYQQISVVNMASSKFTRATIGLSSSWYKDLLKKSLHKGKKTKRAVKVSKLRLWGEQSNLEVGIVPSRLEKVPLVCLLSVCASCRLSEAKNRPPGRQSWVTGQLHGVAYILRLWLHCVTKLD